MSELKVYHCNEWHNEYTEFYIKSEADKVIADLEESHKMEVEQLLMEIAELKKEKEYVVEQTAGVINGQERELRHNKYKRCLAMADKCVDLCHKAKNLYRWAEDENLEHHYNHKIEFFARWHQRWFAIAEQFKEAK